MTSSPLSFSSRFNSAANCSRFNWSSSLLSRAFLYKGYDFLYLIPCRRYIQRTASWQASMPNLSRIKAERYFNDKWAHLYNIYGVVKCCGSSKGIFIGGLRGPYFTGRFLSGYSRYRTVGRGMCSFFDMNVIEHKGC